MSELAVDLPGAGEVCPSCGAVHGCSLEALEIGTSALERLGELAAAKSWGRVVIVADANTDDVLAGRLAADLASAGHAVERVVFAQRHGLLADEAAVGRVRSALSASAAVAAIAVGSGTLNDITRYATFLDKVPYCSVPTAASMDGYASSVAAMQFGGVKVTFPAHGPLGIFAETSVLAGAPAEMAIWGLGDLAGKASACFDWRLSHAVTGEPFCAAIEERVLAPMRACTQRVAEILAGGPESLELLLFGLVQSGVAMAMQGSSRPASGCEHHASHFWDLLAFRGLRAHSPHGMQVGYATRFVTRLQAGALGGLAEPLREVPGRDVAEQVKWLGPGSPELGKVRRQKALAFGPYAGSWPPAPPVLGEVTGWLSGAVEPFDAVSAALELAGVPDGTGFLGVDGPMMRATLRFANRMRSRFTVLDLLESQGRLGQMVGQVVCAAGT